MLHEIHSSIPSQVGQYFMEVPTGLRLLYLLTFLATHRAEKTIVFVNTCETANFLISLI